MKGDITIREKIMYPLGLAGQNMVYNFMSMYIMFFFTDLLNIPVAIATTIIMVASAWDVINDPMMGIIADKTRTRWGRFRPYLIFGPVVLAIIFALCFCDFGLAQKAAAAVAGLFYILWGMSYTVCDIPIWAISSIVSTDPAQKNTMVTLGKIGGTVGTAICTVCSIMVINGFGGERLASAYTWTALIIGAVACVLMALTGLVLRERVQTTPKPVSVRENLRTISCNKPLMLLLVGLLIVNMVNNVRQAAQTYFAVYAWGDSSWLTPLGISLIVGMVLGMALTPALIKRVDKRLVFIGACVGGAVASAIPFFVGGENILFCLIVLGVSFAFTGVTTITTASMLIDAVDYSQYKLGFRGEGLIFSLNTFLSKLSGMLGKAVVGFGLALIGYEGGEIAAASPQLVSTLSGMIYVIPALCFLLAAVPLLFYRISPEDREGIKAMLARNAVQTAAEVAGEATANETAAVDAAQAPAPINEN